MSTIKPFRGYLPTAEMAYKVSSPPYDVLSSAEAREMAQNNPDSFLRIIKPEIDFSPGDIPLDDSLHEYGSNNLQTFIRNGKLIQDEKHCFYIYQITMKNHTQTGIVAAVSVEEYNQRLIKKHEFTRPEKENDRARHIAITNASTQCENLMPLIIDASKKYATLGEIVESMKVVFGEWEESAVI